MSNVWGWVVGAVRRADQALLRVRNSMTPGQRWTSALAMTIVIAVLGFGLPSSRLMWTGYAATPTVAPIQAAPAGAPGAPPPVTSLIAAPLAPAAPAPQPTSMPPPAPSSPAPSTGVPKVVALTAPPATPVGVRDDTAMANAALASAVFPWTMVSDTGTASTLCQRVGTAGRVVLAAHALSKPLEDCLVSEGLIVVSPSPLGTRRPGTGISLSIRRGDVASLADLATWAHSAHASSQRVGLVLDGARRSDLAAGPKVVGQRGLHVAATAWLSTSSSASDVLAAINQFVAAHVGTVVFGVPAAVQRTWVTAATARRFGYVVSDVDGAITDERYPPTFDGALAHTSLRVPWYTRDHAATADQQYCAAQWTSSQTAPTELAGEQVPVDSWCEEVEVLNRAITQAVLANMDLASALLGQRMSSALTSDLGPLRDALWGPTADAVLTWRATCNCWRERAAFHGR